VPSAPTAPGVDLDYEQLHVAQQRRPHKVVVLDCRCHSFDDVERASCRVDGLIFMITLIFLRLFRGS
jgi:hypothetical protein